MVRVSFFCSIKLVLYFFQAAQAIQKNLLSLFLANNQAA
ncbi:hypothetical protein ApDm4_0567 [Acetobacter pomorum]|nr:hypothetical protein ApDm4_0567 [Acetobacter pomorum]